MNWVQGFVRSARVAAVGAGLAFGLVLSGCGMPGAPLPPSLKLPDPVMNLAATRTGNQVLLAWTMPKKNTDKLLLEGNVQVRVCRREGAAGLCTPVGDLEVAPGAEGAFSETLPSALATGTPRALTYFVELRNRKDRSAGLSNAAAVLAGEAPEPVAGLDAEVRKEGVVLRWTPVARESASTAIRLQRKLLTPLATKPAQGPLAPPPEPVERRLLVETSEQAERGPDRAMDKDIRFGETYEYRAQRVARVKVDGQTLELDGPLSAPVRVEAADVFPPAVPAGLAAVAIAGENGGEPAIDLSWQPDTEADLVGYIVYRREEGGDWQRISPAQPVVGPAFHDAHVQAGHRYIYAVSAIDQGGHESGRSEEAEETVPNS
ncbi:MAG TPA: fibronectin type III domain-containing protein [Terracidiphilus sp.]|nr:fibronectin type III domain-containing protein [Terracidiphilus sp.]